MHDLTQRQIEILKSLIEEYIATASAVGSETLEKKHNLSASPATIRNEMVKLTELGYLQKLHTSAGRVPTPVGMKFYVTQLMKEKELSVAEEVEVKEKLWDHRDKTQRFLKELTSSLAEKTGALAVTTTEDGNVYCAGYANILDMPEFFDIDVTRNLLIAIEEYDLIKSIFHPELEDEDVHVLLGAELGPRLIGPFGFVYSHFHTSMNSKGGIGVLGPTRLNYNYVVPAVRYYKNLVEEIVRGW